MLKTFLLILLMSALTASGQNLNKLSVADKIYGLSKFWQEVNYNFVYFNRIDKSKWDSLYKSMLNSIQKTNNDYEYYRDLQKFAAYLKDDHTDVDFPEYIYNEIYSSNFGEYRFFTKNINGKAIIIQTNLTKKNEIPVGTEILEINGLNTQDYINKNVAPYISASTDYDLQDQSTSQLFTGLKGADYSIKIKIPDGKIKSLKIVHAKTTEQELYPPAENFQLLQFKWYDNNIAYCALNSFADNRIDSLFTRIITENNKGKSFNN